jgi:putative transposase
VARPFAHRPDTIVEILAKVDAGTPIAEICAAYEISPATYFRWKRRFGKATPSLLAEVQRLKRTAALLQARNERQAREIDALRSVIRGKD